MRRMQQEIILVSGRVQRIKAEAREAGVALSDLLREIQ